MGSFFCVNQAAVLADNEELRIGVLLVYPLRFLEDIVVIRTGKSLIRRDDKAAQGALAVFGVVAVSREVPAVDSLIDGEDARYLMVEHVKVRANLVKLGSGLAHLCRGDEVHGVGDLLRLLNAAYASADLACAGHTITARCRLRRSESPRGCALPARVLPCGSRR